MGDKHLIYQASTGTIREMPGNYLVAQRNLGRWTCDPDLSADHKMSKLVFEAIITSYDYRYGSGKMIIEYVNQHL